MGRGWVNAIRVASASKKGKAFTKIAKEIAVAVKLGGPSPESNARLRSALKDAQKNSMSKDTVERAIKRGQGGSDEAQLEEVVYEGYGPHGVAALVEVLTDNRNRAVSDLRNIFNKNGGTLGESGSVQWMFERVAMVSTRVKAGVDAEEAAINAGANEVEKLQIPNEETGKDEEQCHFVGSPTELDVIQKSLAEQGWEVLKAELTYRPKTPATLDEAQEKELREFLEAVDDSDDVKRVHLSV